MHLKDVFDKVEIMAENRQSTYDLEVFIQEERP